MMGHSWRVVARVLALCGAVQTLFLPVNAEKPGEISHGFPPNPHGDSIFEVTGTQGCMDCHGRADTRDGHLTVRDNAAVRNLQAKARGVPGPGEFADCFRCRVGEELDIGDN